MCLDGVAGRAIGSAIMLALMSTPIAASENYYFRYRGVIGGTFSVSGVNNIILRNGTDIGHRSFTPQVIGAVNPSAVRWSKSAGSWPNGIGVNALTGRLTGTVTGYPGGWTFGGLYLIAEENGRSATSSPFSITVAPSLTVTVPYWDFDVVPGQNVNLPTPNVTGQLGDLSWSAIAVSGTAPVLNVDSEGRVSFTASSSDFSFAVKATDSADNASAQSTTVNVFVANPTELNPTDKSTQGVVSSNRLQIHSSSNNGWGIARAYGGKSSGKWYFEVQGSHIDHEAGLISGTTNIDRHKDISPGNFEGSITANAGYGWVTKDGTRLYDGNAFKWIGKRGMFAYDADAKMFYFGIDGTWLVGDPFTGTGGVPFDPGGQVFPIAGAYRSVPITVHFSPATWLYRAPPGFRAWSK
jgi:hypothetical protein